MDKYDKAKLKVLIKMVLIQKSPEYLSASQIADCINQYDWGFRTDITSSKVAKLISMELKKHDKNFMSNIEVVKRNMFSFYTLSPNYR